MKKKYDNCLGTAQPSYLTWERGHQQTAGWCTSTSQTRRAWLIIWLYNSWYVYHYVSLCSVIPIMVIWDWGLTVSTVSLPPNTHNLKPPPELQQSARPFDGPPLQSLSLSVSHSRFSLTPTRPSLPSWARLSGLWRHAGSGRAAFLLLLAATRQHNSRVERYETQQDAVPAELYKTQTAEHIKPPELTRLRRGLLGERLLFLWSLRLERRPDHWMDKTSGFNGPCLESKQGENYSQYFSMFSFVKIEAVLLRDTL